MPSPNRRELLCSISGTLVVTSGCAGLDSSKRPAHTVSVYLGARDETHQVTVTVEDEDGEAVFEKEYNLSDNNEADEDATFPASTEPATVDVVVDGVRVERDWPGFEDPQLPCEGENWAGVEIWVETGQDGSPSVRVESNCQHVMVK